MGLENWLLKSPKEIVFLVIRLANLLTPFECSPSILVTLYMVNIVLESILVQLDETEGILKKRARPNERLNPSYPKHLLLNHKDKGLIVIRVQVSHFHRRFLFLPNPFPFAVQDFYLYVRVWRKLDLLSHCTLLVGTYSQSNDTDQTNFCMENF